MDLDTADHRPLDHVPTFVGWRDARAILQGSGLPAAHEVDPAAPLIARRVPNSYGQAFAASDDGEVLLTRASNGRVGMVRPGLPMVDGGRMGLGSARSRCTGRSATAALSSDGRRVVAHLRGCRSTGGALQDRLVVKDPTDGRILVDRVVPAARHPGPPTVAPGPIARLAWLGEATGGGLNWWIASATASGAKLRSFPVPPGWLPAGRSRYDRFAPRVRSLFEQLWPPHPPEERGTASWSPDGSLLLVHQNEVLHWYEATSGRRGQLPAPTALPAPTSSRAGPLSTYSQAWNRFPHVQRTTWDSPAPSEELAASRAALEAGASPRGWSELSKLCDQGNSLACADAAEPSSPLKTKPYVDKSLRRLACLEGVGSACRSLRQGGGPVTRLRFGTSSISLDDIGGNIDAPLTQRSRRIRLV